MENKQTQLVQLTNMEKQTKKPIAKLVGENGNVFSLIAICSESLKKAKLHDQVKEMQERVFACNSYGEAINIMSQYCELK